MCCLYHQYVGCVHTLKGLQSVAKRSFIKIRTVRVWNTDSLIRPIFPYYLSSQSANNITMYFVDAMQATTVIPTMVHVNTLNSSLPSDLLQKNASDVSTSCQITG